jgi:hypothetical protein
MPTYAGPLSAIPEASPRAQEWQEVAPATGALTVIKPQPGMFCGIAVLTAATITVYDNATAASGKVLWAGTFAASDSFTPVLPIIARNGIAVNVSAGIAQVYYI